MAIAGPRNRKGPKGDAGPRGERGPKGERGPQGIQGPQGAQGPAGGGGRVSIKDEGTLLGKAKYIDFTGSAVTATLSGDTATVNITGGGGGDTVKISSNDSTSGYLNGKLVSGTGVTLTENNDGGNETLEAAADVPTLKELILGSIVTYTNPDPIVVDSTLNMDFAGVVIDNNGDVVFT